MSRQSNPLKIVMAHWKVFFLLALTLLAIAPLGISRAEAATVTNLVIGRFFVSGDPRFTIQDIATKSDMFMNHVEGGSKIPQIHGINPTLIALLYRNARTVYKSAAEYQTFLSNGWILKDPNGRLIYDSKFTDNFIVDVGSTGYHQWVANWIKTQLDKYGYNGVNFDLLLPSTEILWRTTPSPAINPRTKKAWTDDEFKQAIIALVNKVKDTIGTRFVVGNSLWHGEHFFGSRYSGFAALLKQSKLDGTEAEAWIMERDNVEWYSETKWKQSVDMVVWLENNFLNKSGRMFLPVAQNAEPYNGQGTALPPGCTKEQYALYAFASLLLGSSTNSHYLNLGWYLPENFPQSLFKIELGSPLSAYSMVSGTHVYARDFSKAKVLVNPTAQPYTVNVGGGYQNFDGTPVGTSITVPAHTGRILKKTGSSATYTISLSSREVSNSSFNRGSIAFGGVSYTLPNSISKVASVYSAQFYPAVGYSFANWERTGSISISNASANPTTVTVSGNGTLKAIYSATANGSIFESGFETGGFGEWDGTSKSTGEALTVVDTLPYEGSYSAKFTSNGGSGYEYATANKELLPARSELYARAYVYINTTGIVDDGDRHWFITFESASSGLAWAGWYKSRGTLLWTLTIRDGAGWVNNFTGIPVTDKWYSVELHWVKDGVSGYGELWVDGQLQCSIRNKDTDDYGDASTTSFGLELNDCAPTAAYVDAVVISNSYIGPIDVNEYVFESGFDTGGFSEWNGTTTSSGETATVVQTLPHDGLYSAKFTSNGGGGTETAIAYKNLSPATSELYARAYVYVNTTGIVDDGDVHWFISFRGSQGLAWAGWYKTGGKIYWALQIRNGVGWVKNYTGVPVTDKWYSVELHWVKDGVSGYGELWVDGQLQCSIRNKDTDDYGDAIIAWFGLELKGCSSITMAYVDSVAIDSSYIGPA